ncbi:hypothetical protein M8J75_006090 [Diaphorina citri]|nr:hypothetical protein M8J75_006090 [Diaphorina citri]
MSGVVEDMAYYKNIVQKLKVADLQNILAYVGKRSNGRKTELQARVLNMIRSKNPGGMLKIKEIYAQLMAANQARAPPPITPPVTKSLGFSVNDYFLPPMSSTSLFNLPVTPPSNVLDSHMAGAVHPDVKFRRLPFYDLIDVLMRPASLAAPNAPSMQYARNPVTRQQQYQFYLSPQHLKHLQNKPHQAQIQVRLCKIEPTEQDDAFPNGLSVRVNNKNVTLPNFIPSNKQNVPSKRPPEPLNITSKCLFSVSSPTKVFVTWDEEYNSPGFALGIFLVDKLDSADLIHRLKSRPARPAEFTMGYIKEKYNSENDSEIKTLELTSSLICPLGKMRMAFPTKASTCAHLQCFDGATFIKMNELKPKWNCPVCDKPAYYDTLSIDGYFYDIIRACPKTNEIQLRPDGTWSLSSDQEKESSGSRSANVEAHRYSPINMSTKDVPAKATSSSSQDAPDIITLDSESESNDSEDPAIVSDDKFSTSSTQLSSKPLKKRFRPDTGTEEEVDLTMCVDLTEDSGDERGGRSRGSAESNGGVTSASATNGVPSEDTRPHSQPWLGFYGGAEGQVSSSGDALSLTSEDRAVPSTEPQTTPGSEDLTTGPKIAAGPPPPEYETLDHVSGEFSNFTRSYSQAYHSKGSSSSDTPVPSIDNPTPPPPTPPPPYLPSSQLHQ